MMNFRNNECVIKQNHDPDRGYREKHENIGRNREEGGNTPLGKGLWHQVLFTELGGDVVDRTDSILFDLGSGTNEFSGSEEKDDDLWVIKPEHKTRELLGFVLDPLKSQGDGNSVEIELISEIGRSYHVLDVDLRLDGDIDSDTLQIFNDLGNRLFDVLAGLSASTDEFTALEQECRGLGFRDPVDKARELLGIILSCLERVEDFEKVELGPKGTRCDDVLDVYRSHRHTHYYTVYKGL